MNTINISLPKNMYHDAKKAVKQRGYSSISELIRDSLRRVIYPGLTENGFTPEFEEMVLRSEKEPMKNDIVLETKEDIHNYFLHLKTPKKRS